MVSTRDDRGLDRHAGQPSAPARLCSSRPSCVSTRATRTSSAFAQGEGYLQVGPEGVLVLVEEAIAPDDLDRSDLEEKLRKAEEAAEKADEDSEERRARCATRSAGKRS